MGWLAQHCTSIVPCPPNNTQSSTIYKLKGQLLILNIDIVQFNYIKLSKDVKLLILKKLRKQKKVI